jgi:hypothetical protein
MDSNRVLIEQHFDQKLESVVAVSQNESLLWV